MVLMKEILMTFPLRFQFILTSHSQERKLSVALEEVLTSSEEPAACVPGIAAQGLGKTTPILQTLGWHGGIPRLSGLMAAPALPSPAVEPGCFPTPSPGPAALQAQAGQVTEGDAVQHRRRRGMCCSLIQMLCRLLFFFSL